MPSVALREIATLPFGLLETIVMLRQYAAAKHDLAAAEAREDKDAASDPRFDLVQEITFLLVRAKQKRCDPVELLEDDGW